MRVVLKSAGGAEMEGLRLAQFDDMTSGQAVVRQFALRVVSELVQKSGVQSGEPDRDLLSLMVRLSKNSDPGMFAAVYEEMKRRRVSAEQIVDIYLPAAISKLGNSWHEGELDIFQATLAMARLQSLLREIALAWFADRTGDCHDGRVFLVLPAGEQHSLGAMVAANQMRRLGISVRVSLLPTARSIEEELSEHRFHAVFVSASNRSSLTPCVELVKTIRAHSGRDLPIALGGALVTLLQKDMNLQHIAAMVGVNIATTHISEALTSCGLAINHLNVK